MAKRNNPIEERHKHRFDAYLGYNTSWWHFYNDYRIAVDDIVTSIESGENPIDTVALPLLFLVRHSIELGLKANILQFQKINKKIDKIKLGGKDSHSIEFLYDKFMEHLDKITKKHKINKDILKQIKEYKSKFDPLKIKLHNLDKGSYCFRYPVDIYGNRNFTWNTRENLFEILNLYYAIQPFILYTTDVLEDIGITPDE